MQYTFLVFSLFCILLPVIALAVVISSVGSAAEKPHGWQTRTVLDSIKNTLRLADKKKP